MTDSTTLIKNYNRARLAEVDTRPINDGSAPRWLDWLMNVDETFWLSPFQHQIDGVNHFLKSDGRMMLAWEMGSGKTAGAALIMKAVNAGPTVIFSPASLMLQHKSELHRIFGGDKEIVIFKDSIDVEYPHHSIVLVSYHRTKRFKEYTKTLSFRFEFAVLDESTYIKNHKAKRTKDIEAMLETIPMVLMLTGTPIINRPVDLFTQFRIAAPHTFKDWWKFTRRYCNGRQGPFGYLSDGLTNAGELSSLVNPLMHRVRKQDCLDLPEKIRTQVPVQIKPKQYIDWQEEVQDLGLQKAEKAYEWLTNWLEYSAPDEKIVVFGRHVEVVKSLHAREYKNASTSLITGDTTQREHEIERFRQGNRILFMTIGAGGLGLNLQFASNMLFVEMSFSPMEMLQAEDRIHRAGMRGGANYYYMISRYTYDENLFRGLTRKYAMANQVVDGITDPDENIFAEIMSQSYKGKAL